MQREQLLEELQETQRQLAERDRQIEELRAQLEAQRLPQRELEGELQEPQRQLAEHDRHLLERQERMRAQWQDQRELAHRQTAERDRQLQERRERLEGQRLPRRELEGELQEPQRQLAEHDRQIQERRERMGAQWQEQRELAQRQPAERDRQLQERRDRLEGRRLADGVVIRRRWVVPERNEYRRALANLENFVNNELGNGRAPRPRPDDGEWRIQRAKTIRDLNELREKLDTICVGANYGRVVGNGAEIFGVGGAVVGAIMGLRGLPSGPTFVNAGNLLYNAGNLIDRGSNVIESAVSAKYLNDIQAVLREDQELSRPLAEWLNFSNELDANVEEIFGISLASEKFHTVMKVFCEFTKIHSSVTGFETTIELMKKGRYSVHIGTDVNVERLQEFFHNLSASPQLANRIRVTLSVLSVSAGGVQVFRDGAQLYNRMMGTDSSSVVPSLQGGLNPDMPTARQVTGFCVFQAINMATSVISLINAASIIRHGKSKYSDAIEQLTRSLAWELRRMEQQ